MRLADVCVAIIDCEHKTAPEGDGFAMSVGTKAIKDGRLELRGAKPVSEETYAAWTRRMRPEPGDLILAREAPVGDVVRVPNETLICLGQRTVLIRPDEDKVHPRFLHYWLLGPDAQGVMRAQTGGATVGHLNVGDIRKLDIAPMPTSAAQQDRTARLLGGIDDLIENNRRRVAVLEEMARAMYREWFVKFRYPGHEDVPLVDSALGPIPEGWEVRPLAAIAKVNQTSRKPRPDEVFRYLDIAALAEREVGELDAVEGADAPGRARRVIKPGDTVWATVRPNRRAHALVVAPGEDWIASTGLAVLSPTTVSSAFLFEATSTTTFSDWLIGRATGSAYPAVRAVDFEEATVAVPNASIDAAFAEKVAPMHELSWKLRAECSALAGLRDLLLPKLVTGQIDISSLNLDVLMEERVAS